MNSLTASQISAGLLHSSRLVRSTIFSYLTRSLIPTPQIGENFIQAIEKYGWHDTFYTAYRIGKVRIGASELPWAIDQLERADELGLDEALKHQLREMIVSADVDALLKESRRLYDHSALKIPVRTESDSTYADRIFERVGTYEMSADECFDCLLRYCREHGDVDSFQDANTPLMARFVERIADGHFTRHAEVAQLLSREFNPTGADEWIVGTMIQLAGHLQMEESAPAIFRWFELDWDWYNECISEALARIGTDAVVKLITERYPTEPPYVQLYSRSFFEHVRSEVAVSSLCQVIDLESDIDSRVDLGIAAAAQFHSRTFDIAKSIYLANKHHREASEIPKYLVTASHLMDIELPERSEWEAECDRAESEFAEALKSDSQSWFDAGDDDGPEWTDTLATSARAPSTVVNDAPTIGRNAPCPCGSGRKYKKCCLKNR